MYCELKSLYTHVGQTRLAPLSGQCHWFIAGDSVDHELSRHVFWSLLPDLRASKSASARFLGPRGPLVEPSMSTRPPVPQQFFLSS